MTLKEKLETMSPETSIRIAADKGSGFIWTGKINALSLDELNYVYRNPGDGTFVRLEERELVDAYESMLNDDVICIVVGNEVEQGRAEASHVKNRMMTGDYEFEDDVVDSLASLHKCPYAGLICCFRNENGKCRILNEVRFKDGKCHFRKMVRTGINLYDAERRRGEEVDARNAKKAEKENPG